MVTGSVVVRNGSGGSHTVINRNTAGHSLIGGSVTVTNGIGTDETELADTSVIGNVTVQNGRGGATGNAGTRWVHNPGGTGGRSSAATCPCPTWTGT